VWLLRMLSLPLLCVRPPSPRLCRMQAAASAYRECLPRVFQLGKQALLDTELGQQARSGAAVSCPVELTQL
jgi:hypothetical protein